MGRVTTRPRQTLAAATRVPKKGRAVMPAPPGLTKAVLLELPCATARGLAAPPEGPPVAAAERVGRRP